ncbi:hypothetical protein JNUCC1_00671 [Lentibacillus sp. JNUCC-1]|uniref:group-specific protein n=1 Tax=Lentibacillus sp. JNUCC-1 TaxID=2654513 RepID=UPI0012E7BE05|nr:group-specific protein [Lentibacillus sp. JNUCC-1]MUV36867.1 hypothetical protein [Lentibacillus sp. JNUCC-1]
MGKCNIDHSLESVKQKLQDQKPYLPGDLTEGLESGLTTELSQKALNDVFHLLKKYDLATQSEREERNEKLAEYAS